MKKRTKRRKTDDTRERMIRRLTDLAHGAYGGYVMPVFQGDEFTDMPGAMGLEAFARWIGSFKNALNLEPGMRYLLEPHNLENYETIEKAADFLLGAGVKP